MSWLERWVRWGLDPQDADYASRYWNRVWGGVFALGTLLVLALVGWLWWVFL